MIKTNVLVYSIFLLFYSFFKFIILDKSLQNCKASKDSLAVSLQFMIEKNDRIYINQQFD